jgi:hypothetical protein
LWTASYDLIIVRPEAIQKEMKLQLAMPGEHETLKYGETTKRGSSWSEFPERKCRKKLKVKGGV